jgi:hypothetical protein
MIINKYYSFEESIDRNIYNPIKKTIFNVGDYAFSSYLYSDEYILDLNNHLGRSMAQTFDWVDNII